MRREKMDEATHMKKIPIFSLSSFYTLTSFFFPLLSQFLVVLRLKVGILMY